MGISLLYVADRVVKYLIYTAAFRPRVGAGKLCSAEACFILENPSDFKLIIESGVSEIRCFKVTVSRPRL